MKSKRYSEIKKNVNNCKSEISKINYLSSLGEKEISEFFEYDREVKQKEKEDKYKNVKNFNPSCLGL